MPNEPTGLRDFLVAAIRVTEDLEALHARGRIHGSIHPGAISMEQDPAATRLLAAAPDADAIHVRLSASRVPFISPEQTGRTNRIVDARTDFYSLGATFYQWLTGGPPFASDDPLEVVHGHIAREPAPLRARGADVPEPVAAILAKLLAKGADDRYQAAAGLRRDLERCRDSLDLTGAVAPFPLGQDDVGDRLVIPGRLYGRDSDVRALLEALESACDSGRGVLMLVAGYSGVGKTSLVRELTRPALARGGHFVSGKVDPVIRTVPHGALIQAFRNLVAQLLTESEDRLAAWRDRLGAALGANAGVLAEVLPEITLVLGPQPPPQPLDPQESQNRFRYVLSNFVKALARPDHPLVLVLDDLQWADLATLEVLRVLMTDTELGHLLVVCACRDNEVDAAHPLTKTVARIAAEGGQVRHLRLSPLTLPDLVRFLGDVLHGSKADVEPLAALIRQKTDGNPFFVIQFLRTLEQEGYFTFDRAARRWRFRLEAIAGAATTDNVVDLMTRKIRWLSASAQATLTLASCIGNRFTRDTLVRVSRLPRAETLAGLAEACDAGLVEAREGEITTATGTDGPVVEYAFLHDQVQQAAYGLIPDEQKRPVHLDVGRLLAAALPAQPPDERLFEVVNHLDIGRTLVTDQVERRSVASLNLQAARRAKSSAAYRAARDYVDAGLSLLSPAHWTTDYELTFALHLEEAECAYLDGAFDMAAEQFGRLLPHAATPHDAARVHALRITLYENQSRWLEAIAAGRAGLAELGIHLPTDPAETRTALDREVDATRTALGARAIASLVDLPAMDDPDMRLVLHTLAKVWAPAYISGDEHLARLISALMVRLSLAHGHTADSAYGYVTHAITIGPIRGDYAAAYEWGRLALRVNERFDDARGRAKIHQQFQAHVNLWSRPFETGLPHAREAYRAGLESGDLPYAGYGAATEGWTSWLVARSVPDFLRGFTPTLDVLRRLNMEAFRDAHLTLLQWAAALAGGTAGLTSLDGGGFDEAAYVARYERSAPFFLMFPLTAKVHLRLLAGQDALALQTGRRARGVMPAGTIWPVLVEYWCALAAAGVAESAPTDRRAELVGSIRETHARLAGLAQSCPDNFHAWARLVDAELARLDGETETAGALFQSAVDAARQTGRPGEVGLACERAARFHRSGGREPEALRLLREARAAYVSWGAAAKVAALDADVPGLAGIPRPAAGTHVEAPAASAASAASAAAGALDSGTVLKVAQAVAREVEVDGLLRRLVELAVENAGATRGVFLQAQPGGLVVQAEASASTAPVTVRQGIALEDVDRLPHRVVRFVQRTAQDVVLGLAGSDERFAGDPYLARGGAKAILCMPVQHQGRLGGILYLENTLTADAFTPARLEVMRVLTAQAAIALENARLYDGMRAEIEGRTQAERALRAALDEVEALKNRLEVENVYLQEEIRTQHNFDEIVGNSPALLRALRKVERVAPTGATVLITGETGVGKELFARAVHHRSPRGGRPLVKVNCGAIPPGLVESELFGHVKGAFTGALDRRTGRFEVANGSTIFLDEISELPLEAQVKLLRVLQEQEFEPVGSSRTVRVDIRVVAATNRDLSQAVAAGRFRADLLYRLDVFPITVPPLRERREDIPMLIGFLAAGLSRRLGRPIRGFSGRSLDWMQQYDWPGNVRELQNVVERAAILATGPVLELPPDAIAGAGAAPAWSASEPPATPAVPTGADARPGTLDDAQRTHILEVLRRTLGVVEGPQGAATMLGLHPNTLRSRMKKLGISPATSRRTGPRA